jgi:outer membrane protein OmpA-like peptidoglycan-associated protein
VRAVCEPCTIEQGQTVVLRAEINEPDGDPTTVRWATTGGTIANTRSAATTWRAESALGTVNLTVTVEDSRGGTATSSVAVNVTPRAVNTFEPVIFTLDSAELRETARSVLDPAIAMLSQYPSTKAVIEGHTCNLGEPTYNTDLGERRAQAVKAYLVQRGIAAERVTTTSLGETRPVHDNAHEETRCLNRRAVVVVKVGETENR